MQTKTLLVSVFFLLILIVSLFSCTHGRLKVEECEKKLIVGTENKPIIYHYISPDNPSKIVYEEEWVYDKFGFLQERILRDLQSGRVVHSKVYSTIIEARVNDEWLMLESMADLPENSDLMRISIKYEDIDIIYEIIPKKTESGNIVFEQIDQKKRRGNEYILVRSEFYEDGKLTKIEEFNDKGEVIEYIIFDEDGNIVEKKTLED